MEKENKNISEKSAVDLIMSGEYEQALVEQANIEQAERKAKAERIEQLSKDHPEMSNGELELLYKYPNLSSSSARWAEIADLPSGATEKDVIENFNDGREAFRASYDVLKEKAETYNTRIHRTGHAALERTVEI